MVLYRSLLARIICHRAPVCLLEFTVTPVSKSPDAAKKFKAISEAFEVLSNDQKRAEAMAEQHTSGPMGFGYYSRRGGFAGARASAEAAARKEQARTLHRTLTWFELLVHPRVLIILLPTLIAASMVLGPSAVERRDPAPDKVPAWFNPRTRRYESPAPWDENFRALAPEVQLVARNLVHSQSARG